MSGNLNVTGNEKRILLVAANPSTSPTTGWPVGFWWAELTHPYWAFTEAGYEVEIRSPEGGALSADGYSDPEDASGYSASRHPLARLQEVPQARGARRGHQEHRRREPRPLRRDLRRGRPVADVHLPRRREAAGAGRPFYEAGKVTALVCHATCLLLDTKLKSGELLVKGKTWTGFANAEEQFADAFVGQAHPALLDRGRGAQARGHQLRGRPAFRDFAVRDGLLVTGQQQFSGAAAARLVIEALGR
jgi:putative intracellular protease/amidase